MIDFYDGLAPFHLQMWFRVIKEHRKPAMYILQFEEWTGM